MISVLINASDDGRALTRTLNVLVTGAVNGLVRDVSIHDPLANPEIGLVADHAGCRHLTGTSLRDAIGSARSDWLLLLEAGAILEPGWADAVRAHILGSRIAVGFMRSPRAPRGWMERLLNRDRALALGVLLSRQQALELLREGSGLGELARRAAPRRLNATILPNCPA